MKLRIVVSFISLCSTWIAGAAAGNWPQFRGPEGNGHVAQVNLPLEWSGTNHVKWHTPIHDRGWSSPVIWGNQVWMATAAKDGTRLFAVCVNRDTGVVMHDVLLFEVPNPQYCHPFNTYASPSPVIEEGRVYVTFGSPGTACIDTATGKKLWERRDFVCNHYRAAGSSPILYQNLLLMHFDGSDRQYVVALNKNTGETVWQVNRSIDFKDLDPSGKPQSEGDLRKAFATPHVAEFGGKPCMISLGAKAAYAYEPGTGRELWRFEERSTHSASTRPLVVGSRIYFPSGFAKGHLIALEWNGADAAPKQLWKASKNVPCKPSLLCEDNLVYMVDDNGVASCLEATSGAEVWRERVGGQFSASPIMAGGRIYLFSEEGKTTVLAASRQYKVLAENTLPDGIMASPAVSGNVLFIRTRSELFRIE